MLFAPLTASASNDTIRIATWNIAWLAEPGQGRTDYDRDASDFARLADYAKDLDADVIALQEIDSVAAAERVFGSDYSIYLSSRDSSQRSGFAVRNTVQLAGPPSEVRSLAPAGSRLRYGMDLGVVLEDGRTMRILAVHLKSICHDKALDSSSSHCQKLQAQVAPLEQWIDARARAGEPFAVVGDFNRRFDTETPSADGSTMWSALDDRSPMRQTLARVTQFEKSECWGARFPIYIDHIVLGLEAARWVVPGSFSQVVYTDAESEKKQISDHCPISVDIKPS